MSEYMRSKIVDVLSTLAGDRVDVYVSDTEKTVYIECRTERSLDFKFKWLNDDHFTGYFIDNTGTESQAVISIWNDKEAYEFARAYKTLVELRASRQAPR